MRKAIILGTLACIGCCKPNGPGENRTMVPGTNPCTGATTHRVTVPSGWRGSVAVIFDGWKDGSCRDDVVCTGRPDIYLGDIDRSKSNECPSQEFVALAPSHPAESGPWPPEVPLFQRQPETVDVAFWLVASEGRQMVEVESTAVANALDAVLLYNNFATGVNLRFQPPSGTGSHGSFHHVVPGSAEARRIGASCYRADEMASATDVRVYESNALNVYYISLYGSAQAGIDCWEHGHREIMYISYKLGGSLAKLPHEIGHALGLVRPRRWWGHTDGVPGFPGGETNLMNSGVTDVGGITLGQVYRLNFDSAAWFNRLGQVSGRLFRTCQEDPTLAAPCPKLALSTPGRWPP